MTIYLQSAVAESAAAAEKHLTSIMYMAHHGMSRHSRGTVGDDSACGSIGLTVEYLVGLL